MPVVAECALCRRERPLLHNQQHVSRIVNLTDEKVSMKGEQVSITFGAEPLTLPLVLGKLVLQQLDIVKTGL